MSLAVGQVAKSQCSPVVPHQSKPFSSMPTEKYRSTAMKATPASSAADRTGKVAGPEDQDHLKMVLKYIEDADLRRWSLPNTNAFRVGLKEWRSKLNCITNPYMYEQLLEMSSVDLISKGNSYVSARQSAASKLLDKVFKIRLGRGFYGECLAVRADGNSNLSDEIGKQLSVKSAAAGLR
ncbi:hypothetical protein LWI28_006686 [Acer negundo]|uniref:Uncharacterized protein n=1 Tax=Acer negundo TaxID=4023 RepID=A0AAD5IU17_ACENE|nr:hypothetical protein LWI28_006686 [Acer negundo]